MAPDWPAEDEAVRYLLGGMSESDRSEFEVRVLGSAEAQEKIERVEMELIDGYLLGRLDPAERGRFEAQYLSNAARREKLELGRLVLASLTETRPVADRSEAARRLRRARESGLLAACVVLAITAGYFAWDARSHRVSLEWLGATPPARSEPAPASVPQPAPAGGRDGAQISFAPGAGSSRGDGEMKTLAIPDGVAVVRLDLRLFPGAPPGCRAVLQDADRTELWRADPLPMAASPSAATGFLLVPARILDPGDYVVTVSESRRPSEELASYVFRVSR